jgi:hypothetical protein
LLVEVSNAHVDVRVGWGVGSVPVLVFLWNWEPVDEDDEVTNRVG